MGGGDEDPNERMANEKTRTLRLLRTSMEPEEKVERLLAVPCEPAKIAWVYQVKRPRPSSAEGVQ